MAIIVQKFGGTSVADPDKIKNVARRVVETQKQGNQVVVVVSAMGKTTNALVDLAAQITNSPSSREMDMLLSTGEQVTISLLAMAIHDLGYEAISFTGPQIGLVTDNVHAKAKIQTIGTDTIKKELDAGNIVIVAGFQGVNEEGQITTLGRGGSDITAVALAAVLKAKFCEIFTDVDGVYTTDPRIVKDARKIEKISYDEMLELASLGAKVLHARSVEFAKKYDVPIHVRSSFKPDEGTLITKEVEAMEDVIISGVALNKDEAKLTITEVPDKPGMAASVFKKLADNNISVDMIIQNISASGKTDISFTVFKEDIQKTVEISNQIVSDIKAGEVLLKKEIAKVSVVGVGMRRHVGVAAKLFDILAANNINIEMISTSEIKISCVIEEAFADKAVNLIHEEFDLAKG